MILPEQNIQMSRFYLKSSAFSPLQQQSIAHQALRSLRGLSADKKIIKQSLRQQSISQQISDKYLTFLKTQSLSTFNPQINSNKQFQKNLEKQNLQELQFKSLSEKHAENTHKSRKISFTQPPSRLRHKKPCKYDFDSQSEEECKESKRCETKNIIKNFIRSVLSFLRKNQKYNQKLLKSLEINPSQFAEYIEQMQGKINTISQLRELWIENKFNLAFRIISSHFLRKYYPKHIFNSRIFNHKIHLKYRIKLLKSLEKPEDFTSLKQF